MVVNSDFSGMLRLMGRQPDMRDYFISIFYSDKDGGYIADIPDLRYCSAFGSPPDEALREVQIAKQAWLEAAMASGKPIPEPRYRPIIYQLAA
jgi:predicted RNase H-like HicB family nuclease